MSVIRDNATALYHQIAARLRDEVGNGHFEPSGRLPSEAEIGRRFAVSRVTVRLALAELANDGLIERRKGKGSYVTGRQVHHELDTLRSFHESLLLQGLDANMRILQLELRASPPDIAAAFGQGWNQCVYLERLHSVGAEPIALEKSFLPTSLSTLSFAEAERRPTYAILAEHGKQKLERARVTLGAGTAGPELEEKLNLARGAPLLLMERSSFFTGNQPAERSIFYIRPERYRFAINSYFAKAADETMRDGV